MQFDIKNVKIAVFIPEEKVSELRDAVCNAGAGVIGNYSYCSSSSKVTGTYIPNEKANPYEGTHNTLEFVEEIKLEFICNIKIVKNILKITKMTDENGVEISEAKNVQQKIWIYTNQNIFVGDILRK